MKEIVAQNIFNCFSNRGNHDLCQDYSFWSSIENCRTDPNEVDGYGDALYPYARKCIAHEKYQHKSEKSTKDSCGNYQDFHGNILDNCPNSKNETDCKSQTQHGV